MNNPLVLAGIALFLIALTLANLPFLSNRYLGIFKGKSPGSKTIGWRFAELFILYLVTIGIGVLIEWRLGRIHEQAWQFYAITLCLFIVLAFPGFVIRYLKK